MVYKLFFNDEIWGKVMYSVTEEDFDKWMGKLMGEMEVVVDDSEFQGAITYMVGGRLVGLVVDVD